MELPYDPVIHFWVYTQRNWKQELKQYLYTNVQNSIIHNCPKVETTPESINR